MIYFDHAAAVPVLAEVISSYPELLKKYSGNQEAAHQLGHTLNKELEALGNMLFDILLPHAKAEQKACFFGSDTTELLNITAHALGDKNAVCCSSVLEHVSVRTMLKRAFGKVSEFPLDKYGRIADMPADIAESRLIVITHVQSEIGVMQDLPTLMKQLRRAAPQAVILLDMVQSSMLYEFPANTLLPDLLLISGAKTGADSGAALLAMNSAAALLKNKLNDLRKKEYLIGKTNIVQAAALVLSVQINSITRIENAGQVHLLNDFLRSKLDNMVLPNGRMCRFTVPAEASAENILHFMLPGYQAGVLVRMFSAEDIMLSSGSACQSESDEPSAVLQALSYSKSAAYSGIRVSLSGENTMKEAEIFVQKLQKILQDY